MNLGGRRIKNEDLRRTMGTIEQIASKHSERSGHFFRHSEANGRSAPRIRSA